MDVSSISEVVRVLPRLAAAAEKKQDSQDESLSLQHLIILRLLPHLPHTVE